MIKPFINLLLYGNFWIALAATAMVWQTELFFAEHVSYFSPLSRFVFSSTLFLYALHRIVGIEMVKTFSHKARFRVISKYRYHIMVYALIGFLGASWYFFQLNRETQIGLLIPALISLAYVLPFLTGKRLRDLHYLKIFLIALVFAWVSVALPTLEYQGSFNGPIYIAMAERALFIFAITLPFDIRDLKVDAHAEVKTIPLSLGVDRTIRLSLAVLGLVFLLVLRNLESGIYPLGATIGYFVALILTGILLYYSGRAKHDYYFSGLLDGTMLLCFLFSLLGHYYLNV